MAKRMVLSHKTFYKACEALKTHREVFLSKRPSNARAAAMLSDLTGEVIGENSIADLKEASEVTWETKRVIPKEKEAKKISHSNALRTLTRHVRAIHLTLGMEIPPSIEKLYKLFRGEEISEETPDNGEKLAS